jgi:acyl-coenzyme A thioesterase PaaI-like protein
MKEKKERVRRLLHKLSFWPPYLGAGIRVTRVAEDFRTVEVELRMRFFNRNYVGTHFGGSLYSMCDPWFMLMLIEHLGPDYIVWDKVATIRFKKPDRGVVKASFHIPEERIQEIRAGRSTGQN